MQIKHRSEAGGGTFEPVDNGAAVGEMTYTQQGDVMIINHTEVDKAFEGKGIGRQLVQAAVDFARQHQFKIKPLCSYAKAVLQKDDAAQDILA